MVAGETLSCKSCWWTELRDQSCANAHAGNPGLIAKKTLWHIRSHHFGSQWPREDIDTFEENGFIYAGACKKFLFGDGGAAGHKNFLNREGMSLLQYHYISTLICIEVCLLFISAKLIGFSGSELDIKSYMVMSFWFIYFFFLLRKSTQSGLLTACERK